MSDIQSIRRAFEILRAVASEPEGATLSDIASHVALPKSTVSRMLSTLSTVGAVEKLGGRAGFRLGADLLALSSNTPFPRNLSAVARPYLQQLAQATGETLTLCVPDGTRAHYIDQIHSSRGVLVNDYRRHKLPMHAVSDGKLYLAYGSEALLTQYLQQPLARFTRTTLSTATALRTELKLIRKRGYAWTDGELDDEVVGVAAPIFDADKNLIGSICVFGPRFRFPTEDRAKAIISQTIRTAERITERIATPRSI
jgi:DNA-binding IclR family transcriptional regulator